MMMYSIQTKMIALVVATLIFILGLYSLLLYINTRKITVAGQEKHLSSLSVTAARDVALWLEAKKIEMATVADSISLMGDQKAFIIARLKLHAKNNPEYEMVFYADTLGNAFTSSGHTANIADRMYFKQALSTKRPVVSDPVISRQTNHPIIVIAAPVKNEEFSSGIVGGAVSLDYLSQRVSKIKVLKTGYAFVIKGDGTTIIHPDPSLILTHNIIKDPKIDPALLAAARKMIQGQAGLTQYTFRNVNKYVAYAPIPGMNWSLAINVPVKEVSAQLFPFNMLIILSPFLVIMVASALISFFLIIVIVRPIKGLKDMMSWVVAGNLDVRFVHPSRDEIGQLAASFNHMVQTIREGREKILQSEEKYRTLAESSLAGVYVLQEGKFCYANANTALYTGYTREELLNRPADQFVLPEDREKLIENRRAMLNGELSSPYELRIVSRQGEIRWIIETVVSIRYQGKPAVLGSCMDVTVHKQMAEKIEALSITDQLTGLFNRRGFLTLAEQQFKIAGRSQVRLMLLFADIDGLKRINDTLGHRQGDEAILEAATILKGTFRESDIVARMGGDEFVVLALGGSAAETADILSHRLQNLIATHNAHKNRDYEISLSIGIVYKEPGEPSSIDTLISQADALMYEQKNLKKSRR